MTRVSSVVAFSILLTVLGASARAAAVPAVDERRVEALLSPDANVEAIRALGPGVLPALTALYERGDEGRRSTIASTFYALGWKSEEAKRVLMRDVHTSNSSLRLQVQWALGRVSNDPDVVDVLLDNMRNDDNPLFRDKAACALANDQIHLTEDQKFRLVERLIEALRDPKLQVRQIALQALRIQTGQTKNFDPDGPPQAREAAIQEWRRWLEAYRSQL
jgi:HEAT repeat protein